MRQSLPYRVARQVLRRLPPAAQAQLQILRSGRISRQERQQRLRDYNVAQRPGLLSFVTTVWNTDPAYVNALAQSVFTQDGGTEFEWFILDNGTTRQDTLAAMEQIARHPCVRFSRVEDNLGIIGGMRYCLEHASGRYILPLDSDDLLAPDCVRILTTQIVENDFPALLYSDEDKMVDDAHITAYRKPDWDPVLFLHSCYIAHLCAIDRTKALELGAYTDPRAEGSHDWDTFTRFHLAGHAPVHVAELLYSWRMHAMSTSSNIGAKPVVYDSQMSVIERFLSGAPDPKRYSVIKSPLFAGSPDWWIRRDHTDAAPLTTVLLTGPTATHLPDVPSNDYPNHRIIPVPLSGGLTALAAATQGPSGAGPPAVGPGRDPAAGMGLGSPDHAGAVSRRRRRRRPDLRSERPHSGGRPVFRFRPRLRFARPRPAGQSPWLLRDDMEAALGQCRLITARGLPRRVPCRGLAAS